VPLARVLEVAALSLQAQAGCPVTFSRTTATLEDGIYQTVVEYTEEAVGRRAALAEVLINAALTDAPFDLAAALAELSELDEDVRLAQHRRHRQRRRGARHSVPPPDRRLDGDVRLGLETAPHPGR
jgi:hypothetical protein